jgi:hypothetical protein
MLIGAEGCCQQNVLAFALLEPRPRVVTSDSWHERLSLATSAGLPALA